jgi:uncharacterized protein YecA (UPF0149 family)
MVRVPVMPAKWSTWRRYCDSAGISMGRAIMTLIDQELARRHEQVARREEKAAVVEERLRAWNAHLRRWEAELETRERRVEFAARMAVQPREAATKVGRNERCPCGSGLKNKHCHGLPGR